MALELLAAIDRPNVGLLLDSFHWYTAEGTLGELQGLTASEVVYVHVNDAPAGVALDDSSTTCACSPARAG